MDLLCTFDIVEMEMLKNPSSNLWCWPLSWIRDVVGHFSSLIRFKHLPSPKAFTKFIEIGVSFHDLKLKVRFQKLNILFSKRSTHSLFQQPDLSKFSLNSQKRSDIWERNFGSKSPMKSKIYDTSLRECKKTPNHPACDETGLKANQKLIFMYTMHSFGLRLIHYPAMYKHPIFLELNEYLSEPSFINYPTVEKASSRFDMLWEKYGGDRCVNGTAELLSEALFKQMSKQMKEPKNYSSAPPIIPKKQKFSIQDLITENQ
jgi:hypothetical protein